MVESKTKATDASLETYFGTIEDPARRRDCETLAALMAKATNQPPTMWGGSIVGFGSYHYKYESGREGDSCVVGFSSRKGDISLYGLFSGPNHEKHLATLGKHKAGKGCLYIRTLGDVDLKVLEKLAAEAMAAKAGRHGASPAL